MKLNKEQLEQAKLAAKNEVEKENFETVKDKLKYLYEKKAMAEKTVANIDREIEDYEMELEG